jgi:hypothetical protein
MTGIQPQQCHTSPAGCFLLQDCNNSEEVNKLLCDCPRSLLSAASKDVLSLPSDVVPSWNSNGTQSFEVVTALLHENQTEVMSHLALWLCPTLTDTSFTHLLMGPRGAADLEQQYTAQSLPVDTMIDYLLGSKGR